MPDPWTFDLRCGCTVQTVADGIAQVSMFDGISGLNVKCPDHGWTVALVGHTRTSTEYGPDYCAECSDAIQNWVQWPCPTVTQLATDEGITA